jgi:hypothetical protein
VAEEQDCLQIRVAFAYSDSIDVAAAIKRSVDTCGIIVYKVSNDL